MKRKGLGSWHLDVMRAFKIALRAARIAAILAAASLVGWLIYAWHYPPTSVPVASITFRRYTTYTLSSTKSNDSFYPGPGKWLRAMMELKNEGNVSISYGAWGDEPYGWANAQTAQGLTNGFLAPPFTGGTVVLAPGSNALFWVDLPWGTTRWDCGFSVETASVRDRAVWKIIDWKLFENDGWRFLELPIGWFFQSLPDKSGPSVKVKSASLEVDRGAGDSLDKNPKAANPSNTGELHSEPR
jgi:hypothetical protein